MTTVLDHLGVVCNQCGRCCVQAGGSLPASAADYQRWLGAGAAGRSILEWTAREACRGSSERHHARSDQLWYEPGSGRPWSGACPWVREPVPGRFECGIYPLRPDACREFPSFHEQVVRFCVPGGIDIDE
ncbi:MAG: YkgJ family cysteine cluster protein [Gammaproteobacteria bacterium]|nr:YkgJ family cysteine cluster protein [Gammaproteobacteria bacterium]